MAAGGGFQRSLLLVVGESLLSGDPGSTHRCPGNQSGFPDLREGGIGRVHSWVGVERRGDVGVSGFLGQDGRGPVQSFGFPSVLGQQLCWNHHGVGHRRW